MKIDPKPEHYNYMAFFLGPKDFERWQIGENAGIESNVHPRMPEGAEIMYVEGGVNPNTSSVWQSPLWIAVNYIVRK